MMSTYHCLDDESTPTTTLWSAAVLADILLNYTSTRNQLWEIVSKTFPMFTSFPRACDAETSGSKYLLKPSSRETSFRCVDLTAEV